jgi:hypothetical protein
VTVPRKGQDGSVRVDDRGEQLRADAHVWHCSLSLHPTSNPWGAETRSGEVRGLLRRR